MQLMHGSDANQPGLLTWQLGTKHQGKETMSQSQQINVGMAWLVNCIR
jgi:hypothetical protein